MGKIKGQVTFETQDDGSIAVDCSKVIGTEADILAMLDEFSAAMGGVKVVEKHVHKHGQGHTHSHNQKA